MGCQVFAGYWLLRSFIVGIPLIFILTLINRGSEIPQVVGGVVGGVSIFIGLLWACRDASKQNR